MTNPNYTHVTMVVDRSGSMSAMRQEAQEGINLILKEQFLEDGEVSFTLVDFDNESSDVQRLCRQPFEYTLHPRSNTALLDAVGFEIDRTGADLAQMPEDQRPARVLFVIVTDGEENASRHHTFTSVAELIRRQTEDYGWNFQYIGPEAGAWQGERLGTRTSKHSGRAQGMSGAYKEMNESLKTFRKAAPRSEFLMAEFIADDED